MKSVDKELLYLSLVCVQIKIPALTGNQGIVIATFCNLPVFYHQDLVCLFNRAQPMGDNDGSSVFNEFVQ
jgi:hypothetical protein